MATQKGIEKWKNKKWFTVYAPKVFENKAFGEIPANDEKALIGRNIKATLNVFTGNPEHSYTNVIFKILEAKGNAANTKMERMELPYSYTKSLAKKFKSVFGLRVVATTKDNTKMVIKLLVITSRRTATAKIKGMRKQLEQFTQKYFTGGTMEEGVKSIADKRFQSDAAALLSDISRVSNIEIKKLEIE
jgi:small subunit ribosomal protein S3Ae